jgi:hypothetical protein
MKRIAIGRKNSLFVGSDAGGKTAAVLFSMTASCHRHGIDPFAHPRDVLDRLTAGPLQGAALAALLPDGWTAPPASPPPASTAAQTMPAPARARPLTPHAVRRTDTNNVCPRRRRSSASAWMRPWRT